MNKENIIQSAFSKIEPDAALKDKIFERIEENEMKKQYKRPMRIAAAVAAAAVVTVVGIGSVFAAGNIISYFQSNKAVEVSDMETLALYNEEVGATVSKFGYTLTLDNIATDDNFMHVFYTLKKDNAVMTEEEEYNFWFICRINGKVANFANHNQEETYLTEDGLCKGVLKLNLANMEVPDTFTLEMYSEPNILKENSLFEGNYLYDDNTVLTDVDKEKLLYLSTTAKKTSVETKSVVKELKNITFPFTYYNEENIQKQGEGEISKAIFSPFGSQMVVKDKCEGFGGMKIAGCALFDENGQSLDILNTSLSGGKDGSETSNILEFLKADANTKSLKIVPLKDAGNYNDEATTVQPVGTYPLIYKVNDYGSIVVTDIRFSDGVIEIDYYKDGFSQYDPYFQIMDKNGNNVEPGGKLGCLQTITVHHNTNSYTAKYSYYDEYDEHGRKIPFDVSTVSRENLMKSFTHLGIGSYDITLDYDNAIDIDLR